MQQEMEAERYNINNMLISKYIQTLHDTSARDNTCDPILCIHVYNLISIDRDTDDNMRDSIEGDLIDFSIQYNFDL